MYHISIGVKSVYYFILSHKTFCLILVFDERCSLPRLPDIMTVESTTTSAIVHWTFISALNTRNETFTILYGRSQEDMAMEAAPMLSQESLQEYSVWLASDLQPGTRYFYRIQSTNSFSNLTGPMQEFKTKDGSEFLVAECICSFACLLACLAVMVEMY